MPLGRPLLLDTCAWLDAFCEPERLTSEACGYIKANGKIFLSSISLWEVATKHAAGKLPIGIPIHDWMRKALPRSVEVCSITPSIAIGSASLPGIFHKDPADRLIVATAREHGYAILTSDARILGYQHVKAYASRPL